MNVIIEHNRFCDRKKRLLRSEYCAFGTFARPTSLYYTFFSRLCEVLLLQKMIELKGIDNNSFYEINFLSFEIRDIF